MSLLQDIIEGARTESVPVSQLLRSLQVLASRSGATDLASWIRSERDGFKTSDDLPSYRGPYNVRVLGHLSGPFGSQVKNIDLAKRSFPDYFEPCFQVELRESMAQLEELGRTESGELQAPWDGDMIGTANGLIKKGKLTLVPMHGLVGAYRVVPKSLILGVVDRVRGRVLDLALELEEVSPELGSTPSQGHVREAVSAVFQTVVHAEQAFVGYNDAQVQSIAITPGDPASLRRYLDQIGVTPSAGSELVAAVADGGQKPEESRWSSLAQNAAKSVVKVAPEVALALIKAAIQKWMGAE